MTPITLRYLLLLGSGLLGWWRLSGQETLDSLIQKGIRSNLVLQQKQIGLAQAKLALKEARTYFYPVADFNASYTSGQGGRYFDFPVGDLLNPVYATLNQMTGTQSFPQIENVNAYLNPYNFYDVHTRVSMAVYNPQVKLQSQIRKEQQVLKEAEATAYALDLARDIKLAFYQYQASKAGIQIYEAALGIIQQNKKTIESLLANGKAIPAQLIRIEAELSSITTQLIHAKNQSENALHYLNFLLNRDLNTPVDIPFQIDNELGSPWVIPAQIQTQRKSELLMLNIGKDIQFKSYQLSRQPYLPKVGAFIDLGSQALDFKINNQSVYYLAGIQLDVPIYQWGRNKYKAEQQLHSWQISSLQYQHTYQQFQLAADVAKNNLSSAWAQLQSAKNQLKAAESYFRVVENGFKQGSQTLLELIDAREQLTRAGIQHVIQQYQVLEKAALLFRETQAE